MLAATNAGNEALGSLMMFVAGAGLILVLIYLWYLPIKIADKRQHESRQAITICTILSLFFFPLWFVAIIWANTGPDRSVQPRHVLPAGGRGFDPVPIGYGVNPDDFVAAAQPGKFRVSGVDKQSKMDTSWIVNAESAENAKAKGELEGILVTGVERA